MTAFHENTIFYAVNNNTTPDDDDDEDDKDASTDALSDVEFVVAPGYKRRNQWLKTKSAKTTNNKQQQKQQQR